MARRVIWSDPALEDLEGITLFIGRDSPHYAARILQDLFSLADQLQVFPMSGRIVPEIGREDIRERFHESYRLLYQVTDVTVNVIAVIHAKRDLTEHLDRFLPSDS